MSRSIISVHLARVVAEAHAHAGLGQFNELQRQIVEGIGEPSEKSSSTRIGLAVSAATNLCLALEISLRFFISSITETFFRNMTLRLF